MRQCRYNGTLLCIHVTIVAVETTLCCLCVVELYIAVSNIKLLSVAIEMLNLIPCALLSCKVFVLLSTVQMYVGLHVKCCPVLIKCGVSQQIFIKFSSIKFHETVH